MPKQAFLEEWKALQEKWLQGDSTQKERERILVLSRHFSEELEPIRISHPQKYQQLEWQARESHLHLFRVLRHHQKKYYLWELSTKQAPLQTVQNYSLLSEWKAGSLGTKLFLTQHADGYICIYKRYFPCQFGLSPQTMFEHQEAVIQRLHDITDPCVEEIIEHFVDGDYYVQIKPFLSGVPFWDWLLGYPQISTRLQMILKTGRVLQLLHSHQICHMDFKPDQVLVLVDPQTRSLEENPDFVLLDYDFSMMDGQITIPVGSAPYYAPEQFSAQPPSGTDAGKAIDTYSFCVFVHRLLTERYPFGDGRTKPSHLFEMKKNRLFHSLWLPYKPLKKIVKKALNPNPLKRPSLEDVLLVLGSKELQKSLHVDSFEWLEKPSIFKKFGAELFLLFTLESSLAFLSHYLWGAFGVLTWIFWGILLPFLGFFLYWQYQKKKDDL